MDLANGLCFTANLVAGAAGLLNSRRRLGCPGVVAIGTLAIGNWLRLASEYEGLAQRLPDWIDRGAEWVIPALAVGIPVALYEGGQRLARARR